MNDDDKKFVQVMGTAPSDSILRLCRIIRELEAEKTELSLFDECLLSDLLAEYELSQAENAKLRAALEEIGRHREHHSWIEEPARKGGCPMRDAEGDYTPAAKIARAALEDGCPPNTNHS